MHQSTLPKSALVRVPGSTSNLGSGFDTLGLAINCHCTLRLKLNHTQKHRLLSPFPSDEAHAATLKLLNEAAIKLLDHHHPIPGLDIWIDNAIPVARGLGTSGALRIGFLAGLNHLLGAPLQCMDLLQLGTELEGHPDNVSPCLLGGFTVSGMVQGRVQCQRFDIPKTLKLVTLVPTFPILTKTARKLLPGRYTKADAAHALNRSAMITAAFASRNLKHLSGVFDDRIHQPYRAKLLPQLDAIIQAGVQAGAIGGFLSGSGSAVMCLTLKNAPAVGMAMKKALPDAEVRIFRPDNEGCTVKSH